MRKLIFSLISVSVAIVVVYIYRDNLTLLKQIDLIFLIHSIILSIFGLILFGARWSIFINTLRAAPLKNTIYIFFIGYLSNYITIAKAGLPLRAYLLNKIENIEISIGATSIAIEIFYDILSPILILFMYLIYSSNQGGNNSSYISLSQLTLFLLILIIPVFLICYIKKETLRKGASSTYSFTSSSLPTWLSEIIRKIGLKLINFIDSFQYGFRSSLRNKKAHIKSIILTILAWLFSFYSFSYILNSMGTSLDIVTISAIISFSTLVGYISMLPGGIGAREVAMTSLLVGVGMDSATAVSASVLLRVLGMAIVIVMGGISMIIIGLKPENLWQFKS